MVYERAGLEPAFFVLWRMVFGRVFGAYITYTIGQRVYGAASRTLQVFEA